jgi:hypothetical protein
MKNYKRMKNRKNSVYAISILASALVWGLVIVGCSFSLKGTGCYEQISVLLFGGAASHLIVVYPLLIQRLKNSNENVST